MLTFTTPQLRDIVKDSNPEDERLKVVDHIDFLEFSELEQSVKEDVQYLKESPLVLPETVVTGWVYEVGTGKVCLPCVYGFLRDSRFRRSAKSFDERCPLPPMMLCYERLYCCAISIQCTCYEI